jgi:hypothetical protein
VHLEVLIILQNWVFIENPIIGEEQLIAVGD